MLLNDVQRRFKGMVLGSHEDVGADPAFSTLFKSGAIAVEELMHVYRNSVLEKLSKVLALTYPTVFALTGERFFGQAARFYARQNPPEEGCLNLYGEGFPYFLRAMKEATGLPYLHDVARYDWLFNAAYYAPDDTALNRAALQALAPEAFASARLTLRGSAGLIRSSYPLTRIRSFSLKDHHGETETLDLGAGGEALMVFRPQDKGMAVTLDAGEFEMLLALMNGKTVREALESALQSNDSFDLPSFLAKHFALETFSAFEANIPHII